VEKSQLDEVERMVRIGSWSVDFLAKRTTWSDEFFRICGYAPQSFEPNFERFLATIHPDDVGRMLEEMEQSMADYQPFSHEYRIVRPDGSERFCQAHGIVFTDERGSAV